MRVYFIFDVKEQFISLYQNNYRVLYNILRQIYYLDKEEINYAIMSIFKKEKVQLAYNTQTIYVKNN